MRSWLYYTALLQLAVAVLCQEADFGNRCGSEIPIGESFHVDCNTCTCADNRIAMCTLMACPPSAAYQCGREWEEGHSFMDDCNTCRCRGIGRADCTRKMCPPPLPSEDDTFKYLLKAPSTMAAGESTGVCIDVWGELPPTTTEMIAKIEVIPTVQPDMLGAVEITMDMIIDQEVMNAGNLCESIYISDEVAPGLATFKFQLVDRSTQYLFFEETAEVEIIGQESKIFIQTDKPFYKPGGTVNMRILAIDRTLKPLPGKVDQIHIQNPNGIRIFQLNNVTSSLPGSFIIQEQFFLAGRIALGVYKIKVRMGQLMAEQTFEIKEYVLPKFEVTVGMEGGFYNAEPNAENKVRICAKYTHGGQVKGTVTYSAEFNSWGRWFMGPPPITLLAPVPEQAIQGCKSFVVPSPNGTIWSGQLKITANVTESVTGITYDKDETFKIQQSTYKVTYEGPDEYHPGLPLSGKIVLVDSGEKRFPGEKINVTLTSTDLEEKRKSVTVIATSDDQGVIQLEDMEDEIAEINKDNAYELTIDAIPNNDNGDNLLMRTLKPYWSWNGRYLQVRRTDDGGLLDCSGEIEVAVRYTIPESIDATLRLEAITTNGIIHTDSKKIMHDGIMIEVLEDNIVAKSASVAECTDESCGRQPVDEVVIVTETASRECAGEGEDCAPPPVTEDMSRPECAGPECEPKVMTVCDYSSCDRNLTRKAAGGMAETSFMVPLEADMSPEVKILVYYVAQDSEIVADQIKLKLQSCFQNKVELTFSGADEFPGAEKTLKLKADPLSFCGYGAVDKSVLLMGKDNTLTKEKVASIRKTPYSRYSSWQYCIDTKDKLNKPGLKATVSDIISEHRMSMESRFSDSGEAIGTSGLIYLSNVNVDTRPCHPSRPIAYYGVAGGGAPGSPEIATSSAASGVRSYFPETWLWDLVLIPAGGSEETSVILPDTITSWVGSAVCLSEETGLGISETAQVRSFKPLFASVQLPYAVRRNEKIYLRIPVFNYMSNGCRKVSLKLEANGQIRLLKSGDGEFCVCEEEAWSFKYQVMATTIGEIPLTFRAESGEGCGRTPADDGQTGLDIVIKNLKVKPEGERKEITRSALLCPEEGNDVSETLSFELPSTARPVAKSISGKLSLIGDVMGPVFDGLQNLVRQPTGCGEQNMLLFAPQVPISKYLWYTGQHVEQSKLLSLAKKYMQIGYQRELNYRHPDGSYSAFGESDKEGSTWLTAFVLHTYARAMEFINIDGDDLERSINYLKSTQREDGCFPRIGHVCHKEMRGGVGSDGDVKLLTIYVTMSLIEAGVDPEDEIIKKAMMCSDIRDDPSRDKDGYTYGIFLNLLTLMGGEVSLEDITRLLKTEGEVSYLPANIEAAEVDGYEIRAIDIEATAYALLAMARRSELATIHNMVPLARWLTSQRNENGGFKSTQDTIVGLEALAQYASHTYRFEGETHVVVEFEGNDGMIMASNEVITESTKMLQKTIGVGEDWNKVTLRADGGACVLASATRVWYEKPPFTSDSSSFNLTVTPYPGKSCKRRELLVCTSYRGDDMQSNMAVVEVAMVTSWEVNLLSLKPLLKDESLDLKRFDMQEGTGTIQFYFESITDSEKCFRFEVVQGEKVWNVKPAEATVYDYYDTDKSASIRYRLTTGCQTKRDLPVLSNEEYNAMMNQDPLSIVQARVP